MARGNSCNRKRGTAVDAEGNVIDHDRQIFTPRSVRIRLLDIFHGLNTWTPHFLAALFVFAVSRIVPVPQSPSDLSATSAALVNLAQGWTTYLQQQWLAYAIILLCMYWLVTSRRQVFLIDHAVFVPPEPWKVSKSEVLKLLRHQGSYTEESMEFQERLLERNGTGEETYWPPSIVHAIRPEVAVLRDEHGAPRVPKDGRVDASYEQSRAVAECTMFACVDDLIKSTGIKIAEIDFLIVNCSLFCPTPSLASSVARKYKIKSTARTYSLHGMGCSASLIGIDLAKQLLQNRANSMAVVISLEEISTALYTGNKRSMLLQNTLFRSGGAAVLLSNRPVDAFRAKYKLLHTVRVQDSSEDAFRCVYQTEDPQGIRGVELSKDITSVAGKTLRDNLTMLGPHVLPLREAVRVLYSLALRRAVATANRFADRTGMARLPFSKAPDGRYERPSIYVPDFKIGIQHFCIHAGGRAVIDGIEQNLSLRRHHTAPSRATLERFGNTSSSSIWYELKFVEGVDPRFTLPPPEAGGPRQPTVRRGDRVLQIAFGSGFKCNSAVWLKL